MDKKQTIKHAKHTSLHLCDMSYSYARQSWIIHMTTYSGAYRMLDVNGAHLHTPAINQGDNTYVQSCAPTCHSRRQNALGHLVSYRIMTVQAQWGHLLCSYCNLYQCQWSDIKQRATTLLRAPFYLKPSQMPRQSYDICTYDLTCHYKKVYHHLSAKYNW